MPKGRLGIGAPGRVICTPPLLPIVSTFSEPPHPLQKIDFHPDALISLFWIVCITSLVLSVLNNVRCIGFLCRMICALRYRSYMGCFDFYMQVIYFCAMIFYFYFAMCGVVDYDWMQVIILSAYFLKIISYLYITLILFV